jgi:prepilin-type N-terminal cleavage/methylation domain-containing protein
MSRRGFSLAELMVALVIAGVIGIALTRLLINQSRFVAAQDGYMRARAGARAGLNVMLAELRGVTWGGLTAATADSVTVRVPFAFGVTCTQPSGGYQAIALFPYDSAAYATATLSGWAWRDDTGEWQYEAGGALTTGTASDCSGAAPAVNVLTNGTVVRVTPNDTATDPGRSAYVYQTIRYAIAPSEEITGRYALWRQVLPDGTREELVAPFDTSSGFAFLVGERLSLQTTVPSPLDSALGLRVRLVGQSEETPEGRTSVTSFDLSSNIVFVNRVR